MSGFLARRPVLVFDLDGTLVDSAEDIAEAVNAALVEQGRRPITGDEARLMIGDGAAVLVGRALAATGPGPADEGRALEVFLERYLSSVDRYTRPYAGVPETLAALAARGHRMGLCTNKPIGPTRALLASLGLERWFSAVIGGDSLPVRKPDPRPALAALELLGARAEQATFIGDSAVDAATARAAGLAMVAVTYGYARGRPQELDADRKVDRFADLLALE